MGEKIFRFLEKTWLYGLVLCFVLLLPVQVYHIWQPEAQQLRIASRLGAEVKTDMGEIWIAAGQEENLFAYLTVEAEGGLVLDALVTDNGVSVGNLKKGLLTLKVQDGDEIAIDSRETANAAVSVGDYPANLDEDLLPARLQLVFGENPWGRVHFR